MADLNKKNVVLISAAGVLLVAALVLMFRDSLFPSTPTPSAADQAAAKAAASGTDYSEPAQPASNEPPPPRGSGKQLHGK